MKFYKLMCFVFLFLFLTPFIFADKTGESHEEPVDTREVVGRSVNSWSAVNPFEYFSQGEIGYGVLMMFLWLIIFGGCLIVILMVLSRLFVVKK